MSAKKTHKFERLCREYRIELLGDNIPASFQKSHRKLLDDVTHLGQVRMSSYTPDPATLQDFPWKADVIFQASRLAAVAKRNRGRNEDTWRLTCEHMIFARFSSEVVCRLCRKRKWRSEIEARGVGEEGEQPALEQRQGAREPCRCSREERLQDPLEASGLNSIFGYRAGDTVLLEPGLAEKMDQKHQEPDGIFGLCQTRNIENAINDMLTRPNNVGREQARQVHEEVQPFTLAQPFTPERTLNPAGEQLLYPFLILESKSGVSATDWNSIQLQTAFPVRTFLNVQHRLQHAAQAEKRKYVTPLVWLFANRGRDWQVSVAFMAEGEPKAHTKSLYDYNVIDVWEGNIATKDGALRLLLLVDYVFDWARDTYRDDIIKKLQCLASGDNDAGSVVHPDSGILSERAPIVEDNGVDEDATYHDGNAFNEIQQRYEALDSPQIVFRHASPFQARYRCAFITADNLSTMLDHFPENKRQKLCQRLCDEVSDGTYFLNMHDLRSMEELWTGTRNYNPLTPALAGLFRVSICCTKYLTAGWHMVCELCIVAVAESAWSQLCLYGETSSISWSPIPRNDSSVEGLLSKLDQLRNGSIQQQLLDCIRRQAVILPGRLHFRWRKISLLSNGKLRDLVHSMCTHLMPGSIKPPPEFFVVSEQYSLQHLDPAQSGDSEGAKLETGPHGTVLIRSACRREDVKGQKKPPAVFCVYFTLSDPLDWVRKLQRPGYDQLYILSAYRTLQAYHTTRDNGISTLPSKQSPRAGRAPWNLSGSLGICYDYKEIIDMFEGYRHSMRLTHEFIHVSAGWTQLSGKYMFHWNLLPWQDPRIPLKRRELPEAKLLFAYKMIRFTIMGWKSFAAEQSGESLEQGVCGICASVGRDIPLQEENICRRCKHTILESDLIKWVKCLLDDKPAFEEIHSTSSASVDPYDLRFSWAWSNAIGGYPQLDQEFRSLKDLGDQIKDFEYWLVAPEDDPAEENSQDELTRQNEDSFEDEAYSNSDQSEPA